MRYGDVDETPLYLKAGRPVGPHLYDEVEVWNEAPVCLEAGSFCARHQYDYQVLPGGQDPRPRGRGVRRTAVGTAGVGLVVGCETLRLRDLRGIHVVRLSRPAVP